MKTLSEQLEYARDWVSRNEKWMTQQSTSKDSIALCEVECMKAIMATLTKLLMLEEIGDEMKAQYRKNNPLRQCECCGADIESGTKCENCEEVLVI